MKFSSNKDVKISIIMPVYNCEQYLHESLGSVLRQTLCDWELLCVDDGSTDNSLGILEEYQQKDKRIHIYTQKNQGAGVARNQGMQYAKGEYIAFLDADDYFYDTNALERMYEACTMHKVDACGSTVKLLRNGVIADDNGFREVKQAAKDNQILKYKDFQLDYGYYGFIFKAAVLKENNIKFPSYRRFQDPPFFVKAMFTIGDFCFVDESLYCYRMPNVSVRFSVEKTIDLLKGLMDNLEFAVANNLFLLFDRTVDRFEVEYCNIICYNALDDSEDICNLLSKANQIVRRVKNNEDYMLAPLKRILGNNKEDEEQYRIDLCNKMQQCKHIYIYGAGNATTDFLNYLKNNGLCEKVSAIIVTSKDGNPEAIDSVPVIALEDYEKDSDDLILITVTSIYRKEIEQKLHELTIENFELVDGGILGY